MEGIFTSKELHQYLKHHLTTNTTLTHKLSMYFKATQKPFDPDYYMLQIWLDYIQLLIETEDDINDIKSTLYILRKGYYRFREYWLMYLDFEERFFGEEKRMKFVGESVRFLEGKREFEGREDIIRLLMAARTMGAKDANQTRNGYDRLPTYTPENIPNNVINGGTNANNDYNSHYTNKVSVDTAVYHTPSSLNENKISCQIEKDDYTPSSLSENKISCQIEKDDYTLSVTESLNKMMNSRLKRCGFDGASNGSAISIGNDRKNTANDTRLGVGVSSTTTAAIRTVRRSIERDLGTTTKNTDKIVLNGKDLQVLSVIGKGGSSKVYKVSHGSNVFALKVIKNVTDRKVLQSYENEINLMIKLKGTAEIIELHDYAINKDEIGCTILLLMEYGESDLTHFLKTRELRTSDIFDIFWQMLMNMNAIYDQRIIHADLKPANFVICGNKLKLIDFGISREIRTDTTNVIQESKVGTINYMSPESLCGNKTSRRSDIWSLGVILYEMVYKRNFMDGMNCWQKIDFLKGTEPVQFPDENTGDSMLEMLKGMCAMCLCKEPEDRPTVKDLIYLVKEHRDAVRIRGRDIKALVHRVIETVERDRPNGHLLVDQMVDEFMEEMRKENR